MKNKKIYLVIIFMIMSVILIGCKKEDKEKGGYVIKFVVNVPENTPNDENIYIAGTLSRLGLKDWDPEDSNAILTKKDNTYEISFELDDDFEFPLTISYKFARGDWSKVEKGSKG